MMLFCTGHRVGKIMSYEEWYENNEDEVNMWLAESGADREMCFDSERSFDDLYEFYVTTYEGSSSAVNRRCSEVTDCLIEEGKKKLANKLIHSEIQEVLIFTNKIFHCVFSYDAVYRFKTFVINNQLIEVSFNVHKRPVELHHVKLKRY